MSGADPEADKVFDERRHLLALAYQLLGSLVEAEDVVQEAYARWYALSPRDRAEVVKPGAWLTKVASRICLDQLRSARVRRERYVGEWVPEPLPDWSEWPPAAQTGVGSDPAERITLDESVNMAFLVILQSMTPAERVAFLLHDVFGYAFREVGEVVGRSEAACRQLASSARRRIRASRGEARPPLGRQSAVIRDFRRAWEAKDIDALVGLLDPDATASSDGGGRADAVLSPVHGGEKIARVLLDVAGSVPELRLLERTVNGQPGLVGVLGGVTVTVMAFDVVGERIASIWSVRNPDKLRAWAPH